MMRKALMLVVVAGLIQASCNDSNDGNDVNCADTPNDPSCSQHVTDPTDDQCSNVGEVYDGAACVCDTANNWTGTPGSCSCKDDYIRNGNNCIPESYVGKCTNMGEVYDGAACVCDTANNWTGNPGSCACASGYEPKEGTCKQIQCSKGEVLLGTSCACDTTNHWTGEVGKCECADGYEEQAGICNSLCGKGEKLSGDHCVCNTDAHWEGNTGSCACSEGYTETNGKCLENITDAGNCLNLDEPAVGKICLFGKYMQTSSGTDMTDLEWQILKLGDDDSFLMITRRVIDVNPYYVDNDTEVTWAQSTMRSWLNGFAATENLAEVDYTDDNFIKKAFNETEKEHIQLVTNTNPKGPMGVSGGEDTEDRVFLLSYDEVKHFFPNDESREALTTEYAKNLDPKVVYGPDDCTGDDCKAFWLTRTPGDNLQRIIRVFYNGFVCPHGTSLYYSTYDYSVVINNVTYNYHIIFPSDHGVRPAIWIKK